MSSRLPSVLSVLSLFLLVILCVEYRWSQTRQRKLGSADTLIPDQIAAPPIAKPISDVPTIRDQSDGKEGVLVPGRGPVVGDNVPPRSSANGQSLPDEPLRVSVLAHATENPVGNQKPLSEGLHPSVQFLEQMRGPSVLSENTFPRPERRMVDENAAQQVLHPISESLGSVSQAEVSSNAILRMYQSFSDVDDAVLDNRAVPYWHTHPKARWVFKRYIAMHTAMGRGEIPKRLVTVSPVGQLCNRLMAISTGFVFALLTQRALVVEDGGFYASMNVLFEKPGFDWMHPPGQPWSTVLAPIFSSPSYLITNPYSGIWRETQPLLCSNYSDHYTPQNIIFRTNQYMVPYMWRNPLYHDHLVDIFGDDLFHPLTIMMFRPTHELLRMRDTFIAQHFTGKFVVGIHIRTGHDFTDHFMVDQDWQLFKDCAERTKPERVDPSDLRFFVATDTKEGRFIAQRIFGEDRVLFGSSSFLISDNPNGVKMALLDILLLAASDDHVHTAWSSFGYVVMGMSGQNPMLVTANPGNPLIAPPGMEQFYMGIPHKSDRREQCVRLRTHQPCFHKFVSWGGNKVTCFNPTWIQEEMLNGRYC